MTNDTNSNNNTDGSDKITDRNGPKNIEKIDPGNNAMDISMDTHDHFMFDEENLKTEGVIPDIDTDITHLDTEGVLDGLKYHYEPEYSSADIEEHLKIKTHPEDEHNAKHDDLRYVLNTYDPHHLALESETNSIFGTVYVLKTTVGVLEPRWETLYVFDGVTINVGLDLNYIKEKQ